MNSNVPLLFDTDAAEGRACAGGEGLFFLGEAINLLSYSSTSPTPPTPYFRLAPEVVVVAAS